MQPLGIPVLRQTKGFNPSSIKDSSGNKLLLQQLLTKQRPTIAGVVYDERTNKGTARPIQLGRCYLFDGSNDYVLLPAGLNVSLSGSTIRIKGYITYTTDGRTIFGSGASVSVAQGGYVLQVNGAKLNITLYQNASTSAHRSFTGSTTLSTNTVYAIDATFTTTTCTMSINGIAETVTIGSATGTYGDTSVRATIGARAEGAQSAYGGKIFGLEIYKDSVLQALYKCDEQNGTIAYDSSGNSKHGTITNSTESTFHSTQDVYSYQNEVGYSKPSTVFIPRNEAIPTQDILGNALTYTGQVPYNGILKSSSCILLNGTNQYASTGLNMNTFCKDTFSIDIMLSPTDGQPATSSVIFGSSDDATFGIQGAGSTNGLGIYLLTTGKLAVLYKAGGNFARADTADVIFTDGSQTSLRKFRFTLTAGSGITILEYINGAWVNLALDSTIGLNGSFSTNNVVMSTFNHNVVGFIGAKNTAGTGYAFFGGKVALFECINASGVKYAQYKMSCGIGSGLCDSSGNSRNGLLYNAPTWSTQDNYHPNIVEGFSKRMFFDQSNDTITLANESNFDFTTKVTVEIEGVFTSGTYAGLVTKFSSGTGWELLLNNGIPRALVYGSSSIDTGVVWAGATDLRDGKIHKIKTVATTSGIAIYVDGVLKDTKAGTWTATTNNVSVRIGNQASGTAPLGGFINYVKVWGDTDNLVYHGTGYGNTDADWADLSGNGNNGTVSGSPSVIRLPALNSTTDVAGYPLTNPAGAYHNGAETTIDMSGGVASPVAVLGSWTSAWSFNTARTNPKFKRTLTSGGSDYRSDRFLAYREALTGTNLTKVQSYTATKAV